MKGLPKLREQDRFSVWLHRIARNLALTHRRGAKEIAPLPDTFGDCDSSDPSDAAIDFEDAQQVHRALERVSLPHREVLTLHFLADLSLEEIAQVIEVPIGTIKSRLHYAKQALRDAIERGAES
jgi:RNA polymerase sigma-70 factor (ECF subfamily)